MKLYLAGRFATRDKLAEIAKALKEEGHEITATWLTDPDTTLEQDAERDMDDVKRADCVVSFTEEPSIGYNTGGRHVEFGAAWALGKKLVLVGPRENIFHHLPGVNQVRSFDELCRFLVKEERRYEATIRQPNV